MLVTFDGPDGVGKSTQARILAASLEQRGYAVVFVREPGSTQLGEEIRRLLMNYGDLGPETQLLLFNSARSHLVRQIIKPALDTGHIVICDRFTDSSLVYQGAAGVPIDSVRAINDFATGGLRPDLTFTFSLHPDEAKRRDGGEFTVSGSIRAQFEAYRNLMALEPWRWREISAYLPITEVASLVMYEIQKHEKFAQVRRGGV